MSHDADRRLGDNGAVTDAALNRRMALTTLSGRLRRPAAITGGVIAVAGGAVALMLHVLYRDVWPADLDPYWRSAVVWAIAVGGPGSALACLRPSNRVGWLVLAAGLALAIAQLLFSWSVLALEVPESGLAFHPTLVWVGSWLWVPGYVLIPTLVLLLFPDGRLPSRRWRWVAAFQIVAMVTATAGFAFTRWDRVDPPITWQGLANPFGVAGAEQLLAAALGMVALGTAASVVSLVTRMRSRSPLQRQQLKWMMLGAVLTVALAASAFAAPGAVAPWLAAVAVLPLVGTTVVAVLRHRLWHVEAVIARSAVATILTLLVVTTYLVVMWLAGSRLGAGGAPLIAFVVVAMGFQPIRLGVQRQVNRLLYGQRDDPYAVLAALGHRLEGAAGVEPSGEALPGVARTVADALRLPYVGVAVDGRVVSAHGTRPAVVDTLPLVHAGEPVGALEVGARRGEQAIGGDDRVLLTDIARGLAGAAHSLKLTRDLVSSRHAIVTAREEERRRLHRDLHDDLGPVLAALVLQLETAHDLVGSDPQGAQRLMRSLTGHASDAVEATRRIVAGLRPANLDDLGLLGALEELAAGLSSAELEITTSLDRLHALPAAVEVVLLRVASEALTNTVRHSGASSCRLELRDCGNSVELIVADNGRGDGFRHPAGVGLRSMRERVEEIGGRFQSDLGPLGTTIHASVPVVP